ncbi:MAG: hypothetical protein ACTSUK_05675, partial [Promethearchaeota archaeon]
MTEYGFDDEYDEALVKNLSYDMEKEMCYILATTIPGAILLPFAFVLGTLINSAWYLLFFGFPIILYFTKLYLSTIKYV